MPVSHKHKLFFVHIPKNAGTTVVNKLGLTPPGHYHWAAHQEFYDKSLTKFSIVRNPWDRVVSCYEYAKMEESYWHSSKGDSKEGMHLDYNILKDKTFEQCVEILAEHPRSLRHQGWRPQWMWICDEDKNIMMDHVLKMETLDEELNDLLVKTGNEKIKLEKVNTSTRTDYRDYYDDKTRMIVSEIYKDDIQMFNYKF